MSKLLADRRTHFALIAMLVVVAWYQVFFAGFISWDDLDYVVDNPDVRGFSATYISNWFRNFYIGNYHPLTMVSYAIDYAIGKQEPFVYHVTNILLHVCNGWLVYLICSRLAANSMVGLFTALLFALHPTQTESVSWIAERKNVLYALFFLLAVWQYIRYAEHKKTGILILVYVFGLASMLSKGNGVALPLSLIAVDIWLRRPLGELKGWIEKAPLLVASLVFGLVAIRAQEAGEFLNIRETGNPLETAVFAGYAYVRYIVRLLVPVKLSVLYPYPPSLEAIHYVGALVALGILVGAFLLYRRGERMLAGGVLFYTVNIIFVLQFVQFGNVLTADRYLYLPALGIWFPLVFYILALKPDSLKQGLRVGLLGLAVAALVIATAARNSIWQSEQSFWAAILETFPGSTVAQNSMAGVYLKEGNYNLALQHAEQALRTNPQNHRAWYNKALIYQRTGRTADALQALNQSIAIQPSPKALFTRGLLLQEAGNAAAALQDFNKVLVNEPNNARAHFLCGRCLEDMGDIPAAMDAYNNAIANNGSESLFYLQRGLLLARTGKLQNALADMSQAIELNPSDGQAWYWRGIIKSNLGQNPCDDLRQAMQRNFPQAETALAQMCTGR